MIEVSIIGQGYVGFPLAIHAAAAGNRVVGYDNDISKISDITQGKYPISELDNNSNNLEHVLHISKKIVNEFL